MINAAGRVRRSGTSSSDEAMTASRASRQPFDSILKKLVKNRCRVCHIVMPALAIPTPEFAGHQSSLATDEIEHN
jgi:hypothetical protein